MKDVKTFVIGFLTCACLFLIMGQTKSDSHEPIHIRGENTWVTIDTTGIVVGSTMYGELRTASYGLDGLSLQYQDIKGDNGTGSLNLNLDNMFVMKNLEFVYEKNW